MRKDRTGERESGGAGEKERAGEPESRRGGERAKSQEDEQGTASGHKLPGSDRRSPEGKAEKPSGRVARPKKVWEVGSGNALPGLENASPEDRSEKPLDRASRPKKVRETVSDSGLPGAPAPRRPGSDSRSTQDRSERHSELVTRPTTRLDALQANLGHFFKDPYLLRQALTHPSAAVEEGRGRLASYERLEFLGDSVVGLNLALLLYDRFPKEDEGVLTRMRAYWASQVALSATARELGLESFLRLGAGEARDGGANKDRTLASALEACFGALFLDGGPRAAAKLAKVLWAEPIRRRGMAVLAEDAKTALQEERQAAALPLPEYRTVPAGEGFSSSVVLDGEEAGHGEGNTRKAAEQAAARAALAAAILRPSKDKA